MLREHLDAEQATSWLLELSAPRRVPVREVADPVCHRAAPALGARAGTSGDRRGEDASAGCDEPGDRDSGDDPADVEPPSGDLWASTGQLWQSPRTRPSPADAGYGPAPPAASARCASSGRG